VVHEALIREWGVLGAWIEEHREFLEWEKRTRIDIEFYNNSGKKEEDLLKNSKLLVAKDFLMSHGEYISDGDRWFVEKSLKRDNQVRIRKGIIVSSVFLAISGLASYGFWQKGVAENTTNELEEIVKDFFKITQDSNMSFDNKKEIYLTIINGFKQNDNKKIKKTVSRAYNNLGLVYTNKKQYQMAIENFNKAININNQYKEAYNNMGITYFRWNHYKEAIKAYKNAIAIKKSCKYYSNLIEAYFYQSQKDKNITKYFYERKKLNCSINKTYYYMAKFEYEAKKFQKSIKLVNQYIKTKTDNYKAYSLLGNSYIQENNFTEAIESYKKALKLKPKIEYLYVCFFGCQLVNDVDYRFDKKLEEEFNKLAHNNHSDNVAIFKILKQLQQIAQKEEMEIDKNLSFPKKHRKEWCFGILDKWIDNFEDKQIKAKLEDALKLFKYKAKI
jgi:tetratricopeptide (TPR) repeat protein